MNEAPVIYGGIKRVELAEKNRDIGLLGKLDRHLTILPASIGFWMVEGHEGMTRDSKYWCLTYRGAERRLAHRLWVALKNNYRIADVR